MQTPPTALSSRGSILGLLSGTVLGAAGGAILEMSLRAAAPSTFGSSSLSLAIAGALAGAAAGIIVGAIISLPARPADPSEEAALGPDPVQSVLPAFLIPPIVVLVEGIIIVTMGSVLLMQTKMNAVWLALGMIIVIAVVSTVLAQRPEPPSRRGTDSHLGH